MLAATDRLQKTSERLQVGKQQIAETEVSMHPCNTRHATAGQLCVCCCMSIYRLKGIAEGCSAQKQYMAV